jgi:hypothetical protein
MYLASIWVIRIVFHCGKGRPTQKIIGVTTLETNQNNGRFEDEEDREGNY